MASLLTRNVALFGGMIAAGLICTRAVAFMHGVHGEAGPTIVSSARPLSAAIALGVVLVLATTLAALVARIVNAAVGLFVLGAGVVALDSQLAELRTLVFWSAESSTMFVMAVETLMLAGFGLLLVFLVFRFAGGLHDVEPDEQGHHPHWLWSAPAFRSAVAGVLVLPAVWLIAQTPMKGQALAAVIVGSMAAGLVARLVSPHVQPMLIFVSPVVFGAMGHLIAGFLSPAPLDAAYVHNAISVFARIMPLDYLAGSLLGVAMGLGWAKSFLHHEETPQAAASPS